jgi:hypothetical protein
MRPADLMNLNEAAAAVGRSAKTLRGWASSGRVTRWREVEGDPSSRVLVSLAEVLLAAAALAPTPGPVALPLPLPATPPPSPSTPSTPSTPATPSPGDGVPDLRGELAVVRAEVVALRAALAAAREVGEARATAAREVAAAHEQALAAERARCGELVATVADLRDRLDRAEAAVVEARAELTATRAGRSWWQRLIGGPVQ